MPTADKWKGLDAILPIWSKGFISTFILSISPNGGKQWLLTARLHLQPRGPGYSQRTRGWNLALYFKLVALVFPVAGWEVTNTDITSLQARRPGIAVGEKPVFKRKYPKE